METPWFIYKECKIEEDCPIFFYFDVTLKVPIKDFPIGSHFGSVEVDHLHYTIEFYKDLGGAGEPTFEAKFSLQLDVTPSTIT